MEYDDDDDDDGMPEYLKMPDEYLIEIGRIAVRWGHLESLLVTVLCTALSDNDPFASDGRPRAAFTHMAWPQKMDALSSMLKISRPDLAQEYLEKVQPSLKDVAAKRNAALHQQWDADKSGVTRTNVKARGTLEITSSEVPISELKQIVKALRNAQKLLIYCVLAPLMEKYLPQRGQ